MNDLTPGELEMILVALYHEKLTFGSASGREIIDGIIAKIKLHKATNDVEAL